MPLLLALLALAGVLLLGIVLGIAGLLRRPFRTPVWQPVFGFPLALRAVLLVVAVVIAVLLAAWRHPEALQGLGYGLGVGLLLGGGAGMTAGLRREGRSSRQRPNRLFMVLLAVAVLARALLAMAGGLASLPAGMQATLPMLGGLLLGYPLAHAVVLRLRLVRLARLRDAG